jgi:hypothetical protein
MGEYYEEDVYYGERGNYEHEIQKKTISPISNKPGWALAQIEKWANRLEGCGNFHREEFVLFLVDEEREGDTNMSSIKIFKITVTRGYRADEQGSRYSLEPWSGDNIDYSGYDDGGTDYILPDEYELGEDITGALRVYRKDNGQHIEISGLKAPVLIDDKPRGIKLMPLGGRYVG